MPFFEKQGASKQVIDTAIAAGKGEIGGEASTAVITALSIHLFFAVTTPVLWIVVIAMAWRRFPNPAAPNVHSAFHRRWARLAAWDMALTTVTGWVFYVMAFAL